MNVHMASGRKGRQTDSLRNQHTKCKLELVFGRSRLLTIKSLFYYLISGWYLFESVLRFHIADEHSTRASAFPHVPCAPWVYASVTVHVLRRRL